MTCGKTLGALTNIQIFYGMLALTRLRFCFFVFCLCFLLESCRFIYSLHFRGEWRKDVERWLRGLCGQEIYMKTTESKCLCWCVCVLFLWASLNLQLSKPSQRQQKCSCCPWPLKTSSLTAGWSCNIFLIRTSTLPKSLWSQLLETKHPIPALVLLIRQSFRKDCLWVWPSISFAPALSQHSLVLPAIFTLRLPVVLCTGHPPLTVLIL